MITERVECAVIGAGVIGLAVARALALAGREVVVLERADAIGTQTSSRNSEVIHAGIYYARDSLKARFCVAGRDMLYRYCEERGIAHARCGKLIAAADEAELARLDGICKAAAANGVDDMRVLDAAEAKAMEPALSCVGALLSPSTGILDSHAYMLALQGDAEEGGAVLALNCPVEGGAVGKGGIVLEVGGDTPVRLDCKYLVNSAGLAAQAVAGELRGFPPDSIPRQYLARGNYFTLAGPSPFSRLIYPVPEPGGLGVHFSLDMGGQARFGPDVEPVESIDYTVDPARAGRV